MLKAFRCRGFATFSEAENAVKIFVVVQIHQHMNFNSAYETPSTLDIQCARTHMHGSYPGASALSVGDPSMNIK